MVKEWQTIPNRLKYVKIDCCSNLSDFEWSITLKTRINALDGDLGILDQSFQHFLEQTDQWFHKTFMTLNNHLFDNTMLTRKCLL